VEGIEANEEACGFWLERSLCLVTALVPYIGYEKAAELVRRAQAEGKTIREVAVESGLLKAEEVELILSTAELTRPGIAGAKKLKPKRSAT